jgi:hypothetical protein
MAKAAIAINRQAASASIEEGSPAVSLFFETLAEIGMSEKEAAYTMAMDPAQVSRVKSGQARLPFDAVWRMPDQFWSVFAGKLTVAKGLCERTAREMKAARVAELVRLLLEVA